jgi:DNA-directed RNA polymerase II subunit RPB2
MVKIILKVRKIPERGDKFANMNAQKGTCGIQIHTEDMPFCCEDGIIPDIIVNPHALPSRMTISMLMELILGQECCLDGTFRDATLFEPVQAIGDVLHAKGYERFGMKRMIDGTTGHMFEAQIFCGVNYYQKLKHMVSNKINARNFGNVTALTRQPVSGRSKQGGIRAGEMEVQAILAQGSGAFLWERLVSCSDDFSVLVCARCGIISNDKEQCHVCQEPLYNTILPYASKLVFQLLNSCMISTKFQIKQI